MIRLASATLPAGRVPAGHTQIADDRGEASVREGERLCVAVAAVADDDARQVDALFGEDALLLQPPAGGRVGVRRDRDSGAPVRLRRSARSTRSTPGSLPVCRWRT
jgi:hypothetical protein